MFSQDFEMCLFRISILKLDTNSFSWDASKLIFHYWHQITIWLLRFWINFSLSVPTTGHSPIPSTFSVFHVCLWVFCDYHPQTDTHTHRSVSLVQGSTTTSAFCLASPEGHPWGLTIGHWQGLLWRLTFSLPLIWIKALFFFVSISKSARWGLRKPRRIEASEASLGCLLVNMHAFEWKGWLMCASVGDGYHDDDVSLYHHNWALLLLPLFLLFLPLALLLLCCMELRWLVRPLRVNVSPMSLEISLHGLCA